jgi:hypothetical protein
MAVFVVVIVAGGVPLGQWTVAGHVTVHAAGWYIAI